jgi:osmotically-inducible protein OsmY
MGRQHFPVGVYSVENGVATLTGAVDTKSGRSMAEANAYEGGASRVINNLEIR